MEDEESKVEDRNRCLVSPGSASNRNGLCEFDASVLEHVSYLPVDIIKHISFRHNDALTEI